MCVTVTESQEESGGDGNAGNALWLHRIDVNTLMVL